MRKQWIIYFVYFLLTYLWSPCGAPANLSFYLGSIYLSDLIKEPRLSLTNRFWTLYLAVENPLSVESTRCIVTIWAILQGYIDECRALGPNLEAHNEGDISVKHFQLHYFLLQMRISTLIGQLWWLQKSWSMIFTTWNPSMSCFGTLRHQSDSRMHKLFWIHLLMRQKDA